MASRADERAMISEQVAPVLLAKTLTSFDLVVIFVGIVLFITNSAGWQFVGPAAFIYLIAAYLAFFIPGAFVTAQLGRMFPEEGSIYVWTHKALGPFWGFFAGFVAWWPGPLVMAAAGTLVVTFSQSINPNLFTEPWQITLVILAVVWFSAGMSILRQRITQNYINFQFYFYASALFVMGLAGLIYLWKGNPAANSFASDNWNPFIYSNLTIFGFAFLALLGIEVPLNMGVEVKSEGAIKKYLFWGSVIVMVAYLWTTFGNMAVVPLDINNGTTGGVQGVQLAITDWVGDVVALILIWFFVNAACVYNYSFARLLFVSGLEKRLPGAIGRVNRNKVPANAVILQTLISSVIAILFFYILPTAGTDANKPYFGLLASVNIIWALSMLLLFADVFLIKRWFPEKFERERRVPAGFLALCGAVGFIASVAAIYTTLVAPWYGGPTGWSTSGWRVALVLITLVSALVGVVIYVISQRTRGGLTDEQLIAEAAPAGGGGGAGS